MARYERKLAAGMFGEVWTGKYHHMVVAVKKLKTAWVHIPEGSPFREELIKQMELEAGEGGAAALSDAPATTSSGEPLDSRSLAAQESGKASSS